jgi:hypothetical protein
MVAGRRLGQLHADLCEVELRKHLVNWLMAAGRRLGQLRANRCTVELRKHVVNWSSLASGENVQSATISSNEYAIVRSNRTSR